jgi:RNA polymerase sigma-70 factor (ECF subfamily)
LVVLATPTFVSVCLSILWPGVGEELHSSELNALKAGDEDAFTALVQRYHGSLIRLAMGYVKDHAIAEDVVQETWLTCIRGLDRFEGRSTLKTWIFGIALNIARSRGRREGRVLPFASLFRRDAGSAGPTVDPERFGGDGMWKTLPTSWANVPEERALGQETMAHVREAIDALPAKQREVIVLRDVAGLDAGEVCGLLSISQANQRVRLHRARAAVRKMLEVYLS